MSGFETPIRVTLNVKENIQQYGMRSKENSQQYGMRAAEAIGIISGAKEICYDTTANWNSQPSLIAKKGYIYIYSDYSTIIVDGEEVVVPRMKVGDGSAYLIDMPFVGDDICDMIIQHINDASIHITPQEREFWNNKSSAFTESSNPETLILSNTQYMLGGNIYNG